MKVSAILSAALLAATTSAYRISLYSQYDYQGNQKSYVSILGFETANRLSDANLIDH